MAKLWVVLAIMVAFTSISKTTLADNDMLQDLCVADLTSDLKINGFPCKATFNASDFFTDGLAKPGSTNNLLGSIVSNANVNLIPGLNTLGVSMARIDYAPGGLNPPHYHPRGTEIVFILKGKIDVGFITTTNVLVSKTLKAGDIFVFPRGLVHFQKNNYKKHVSLIAGFNSQLQGTESISAALFTSKPPVSDLVLAQTFQISSHEVVLIRKKLNPKKD